MRIPKPDLFLFVLLSLLSSVETLLSQPLYPSVTLHTDKPCGADHNSRQQCYRAVNFLPQIVKQQHTWLV